MSENISLRISFLRIFLIIQVVTIHSYGFLTTSPVKDYSFWIQNYFSNVIARPAVPLFFIISAYLLFLKIDKLSISEYNNNIKKRIITLLIPHVLWNLIYLGIYFIINRTLHYPYPFHFNSLFDAIWGISREPVAYQFWFIRDLFTLTIFYPLFYILGKYLGIIITLILGIIWLFNIPIHLAYIWNESIFFFFVGMQLAKRKKLLLYNNMLTIPFFLVLSIIDLIVQVLKYENFILVHRLTVFVGVVAFWNLTNWAYSFLVNNKSIIIKFAQISFGIFVLHQPIMTTFFKKIGIYVATKTTEHLLLPLYIITIFIVVLISAQLTLFLKKIFPKYNYILLGK